VYPIAPRRARAVAALALFVWSNGALDLAQQPADRSVETSVRDVLQRYAAAMASLDAEAVRKFQPSVDVESLKRAFREMRALDVAIDDVRVLSSDRTVVRVSCLVKQTLIPKAGSKQATSVTRVMRLRTADGSWVIDSFER
jgi:hypothetical protein